MSTMEFLKLAEEVADLKGVHREFSKIYFDHRLENGILTSVKYALEQLNLWETYNEYR
jgi:hypothetical protein